MGAARTAFARANARLGVLAGIAAVVFLLAGLGTVVVDSLTGAATGGLRSGLGAATGADGAARWQIRLAEDPTAQAEAAAIVLDRMLVPNGATWGRSIQSHPVDATAGASSFGAVLLADTGLQARARLVDGSWPDAPESIAAASADGAEPATLHAAAAAELGVHPGDLVTLRDDEARRLLVVGTWEPIDRSDPHWFGEPIIAAGAVDDGVGPFVVNDDAMVDLPASVMVRWTAVADTDDATPESASALRAALPNVEPALRNQPDLGVDGLDASGDLGATLTRLLAGISAVRAIAPLPVLLLAFAGIAALTRLAALLGSARRGETVLLLARGASASRLAWDTALEVLVVGVPSALVGAAGAEAFLALTRPGEARDWAIAGLAASLALVAAVVFVAGRTWLDARRPVLRGAGDEVGRMPRTAVAGGVILLVAVAAISLWQFRLYGSPLVTSASGRVDIDPVAVLAPVLVLLALSLVALGLSRPISALLERFAAARRALVPSLPMRQLARRSALYASASLVTMLAVAGLTLAAVFAGAWQAIDREVSALTTGGEVRVAYAGRDLVRGPDPLAVADPFAEVDGVTADGPVFRGEIRIGADAATLVAAPADALAAISPDTGAPGRDGPLAESAAVAGAALPDGAAALDVDVAVTAPPGTPGRVAVSVWLLAADGAATLLPAGEVDIASGGSAHVELPDAPGLRLLGLQAALVGTQGADSVNVVFGTLEVDGAPVGALADDGTLALSSKDPTGRVSLAEGGSDPLPVLLGSELATRITAQVGDRFAFRIITGGAAVDAVVAGIVPVVPAGGTNAVLADLGALERYAFDAGAGVPQFGERWLAASDPERVAADLERDRKSELSTATRQDASSTLLIGPAITALWAGAAGALLFALIAIVALTSTLGAGRFGEIVVLRALGVPARTQSRARFAELAVTLGTAVVIGILVGLATAALTARELARAAVADAPGVLLAPFSVDWAPWIAGLAVFAVLAAVVAAGAAVSVGRTAARPGLREEER